MRRIIFLNILFAISSGILAHQNYQDRFILKNDSIISKNNTDRVSGYIGSVEIGYSAGPGIYGMNNLNLNVINSYKLNSYFSIGAGIGYRYYSQKYFDQSLNREDKKWYGIIPVFLDLRTSLTNKNVSPCFSVRMGYSFGDRPGGYIMEIGRVGFLLNGAVGLRFKISDKTALTTGIVFEMQRVDAFFYRANHGNSDYSGTEDVTMNSLGINIGFSF